MPALTTFTPKDWVNESNPLGPPANPAIDTQLNAAAVEDLEQRLWNAMVAESVQLQGYADGAAGSAQAAAEAYADGPITITTKTGNYTLVYSDRATRIEVTAAAAITIPPISGGVPWLPGHWLEVAKMGTGAVTVVQGSGVTLRPASPITIATQYDLVRLVMSAPDVWVGNL